jgi:hypothetical protein
MKKKQKFPRGWNAAKVQKVIDHYDNLTDEERWAEIEAARKSDKITMMAIPNALVPKVQALLAKRRSA